MRSVRRYGILAGALVVAVVGCGSASNTTPGTTTAPASTQPGPATGPTPPSTSTSDVRVYFLRGNKLEVAHRTVAATPAVATAAMHELLAGPTAADTGAGLVSSIPGRTELHGITINGGTATVDVSGAFAGDRSPLTSRLAQVTYTLTQFPTVGQVAFRVDGAPLAAAHSATRSSFDDLAPSIRVEYPGRGWSVPSPIAVSGTADVFEAQFRVELTDASGAVLAGQAVHASSGTGTRGAFATSVAFPTGAAGPGTLTVFDLSAKDGSRVDVVQIPLELVRSE
jgi:germination protein M